MSIKSTGIIRKIDELGRFVIPKEIRRNLGLDIGTPMEIYIEGDRLVIEKYQGNLEKQEVIEWLKESKEFKNEFEKDMLEKAINLIK